MKLQPGIQIICEHGDLTEKIQVNTGVVAAFNYDKYNEKKYAVGSYKPKIDWRPLTLEELDMVTAEDDRVSSLSNIGLRSLPMPVKALFESLSLHQLDDEQSVKDAFRDNPAVIDQLTREINLLLYSILIKDRDLCFHRLTFTKPGLETITYYPKLSENQREYIGLHVDKSEPVTEDTVGTTRNRLCINISDEPRDLLMVNLTLSQVLEMLKTVPDLKNGIPDVNDVTGLFFRHFPDYPVLKVRQEPYEYYLAPTDNFFHDGSTLNKTRLDYTMIYLGYFNLFVSDFYSARKDAAY